MHTPLLTQNLANIDPQSSTENLESGKILFYPNYFFKEIDSSLLTELVLDGHHKNVSYDYQRNKMGAFNRDIEGLQDKLMHMMRGYAEFAHQLIQKSLPIYIPHLRWGRTSFRPAQIQGRALSKRKDDTRLHVDSFAASPVNGLRILRVFCNINPEQEPRVWNVGEPFAEVMKRFAPQIKPYSKISAHFLKLVKATKSLRSAYDHYMLHLHDSMKLDDRYQAEVVKTQIDFPARSSWIVFTDHVSHAALSGQYLLEQTFYLPVEHMGNPEHSPFNAWKRYKDL
ncbi:MAG: hypothetical protein EPN84_07155 [Legionella sp.]|nr:MAG: hypothetical protein EPN84_07155 [Legionella sp.]